MTCYLRLFDIFIPNFLGEKNMQMRPWVLAVILVVGCPLGSQAALLTFAYEGGVNNTRTLFGANPVVLLLSSEYTR